MADFGVDNVVVRGVVGVVEREVADDEGVGDANAVRDAVDGTAGSDDGLVAIAVDPNNVVTGKGFLVNADRCRVVFLVVGRKEDGVVDEDGVRVSLIPTAVVRIASAPAEFGRTWDANDLEGRAPPGGEVGEDVFDIGLDLRTICHARRIFGQQDALFIQQLHVHVDVVNSIERQRGHFDVRVNAVKRRHDVIDFRLGVVGVVGPPSGAAHVFVEDKFGGECGAEAVDHPVAASVHEIGGGGRRTVERDVEGFGQDVRDHVVVRSWAIVQPIHQDPIIVVIAIDRVGAVIANPNRIVVRFHDQHIVQGHRAAARGAGQGVRDFGGGFGEDDDLAFIDCASDDLFQDAGVARPSDGEGLDFFPLSGRAEVVEGGRGLDASVDWARREPLAFNVIAFFGGEVVGPNLACP